MNVSVLGCGRWGGFLAWYATQVGHRAVLWGRAGSDRLSELRRTRRNRYLQLPDAVELTDDLAAAVAGADVVLVAVASQQLRDLCGALAACDTADKTFVLCMKGMEASTGKRLTEVFREELGDGPPLAIWVGPGHVEQFVAGTPNCMVLDSDDPALPPTLAEVFTGPQIRFYFGSDLIGNEIGAAAKNVLGIAAGMLDGLGLSSLKGALMARGAREVSRLVKAMGGQEITVYGLSHLGDYEATLFSPHSHNRRFGETVVRGEPYDELAEGVGTAAALNHIAGNLGVDLPISCAVHAVVADGRDPKQVLHELFGRPLRREFDNER